MDSAELYDEFGNYIGPELESEEEDDDDDDDEEEDDRNRGKNVRNKEVSSKLFTFIVNRSNLLALATCCWSLFRVGRK